MSDNEDIQEEKNFKLEPECEKEEKITPKKSITNFDDMPLPTNKNQNEMNKQISNNIDDIPIKGGSNFNELLEKEMLKEQNEGYYESNKNVEPKFKYIPKKRNDIVSIPTNTKKYKYYSDNFKSKKTKKEKNEELPPKLNKKNNIKTQKKELSDKRKEKIVINNEKEIVKNDNYKNLQEKINFKLELDNEKIEENFPNLPKQNVANFDDQPIPSMKNKSQYIQNNQKVENISNKFDEMPIKGGSNFNELLEKEMSKEQNEGYYESNKNIEPKFKYVPKKRNDIVSIPTNTKKYKYYSDNFKSSKSKKDEEPDIDNNINNKNSKRDFNNKRKEKDDIKEKHILKNEKQPEKKMDFSEFKQKQNNTKNKNLQFPNMPKAQNNKNSKENKFKESNNFKNSNNNKAGKQKTENIMDFESFKKKKNLGNNTNKNKIKSPWNNIINSKKEEPEEYMQDIDNKSENSLDDFKDDENDDIIMMKNENNEYKINPNQIKQDSHLFKEEMPPDDLNDDNNNESDNDNNKNEIKDENNNNNINTDNNNINDTIETLFDVCLNMDEIEEKFLPFLGFLIHFVVFFSIQ